MRIRFLGTHNAESKNTRLISFLIDEVLAVGDIGFRTKSYEFIKKLHDIQSRAMDQIQKTKGSDELKYIG